MSLVLSSAVRIALQDAGAAVESAADGGLFARADAWPLLLLVPLVGLAVHAVRTAAVRARARWSPEFADRAPGAFGSALRAASLTALLVLAWMDPRAGVETVRTERRGVDLVVCVDVSRSMLASDLPPSRLERAKRDLLALLGTMRGGDRIALVAFAGEARLLVPLTHDAGTLRAFVEDLDWQTVRVGGSDLAAAIDKGVEAIDPDAEADRAAAAIVLLTDGEDLEGLARDAARAAGIHGVVVHTIGYGSARGSKITQTDEDGRESFVRSPSGDEVVTTLDADALRDVAEAGAVGGVFLRADAVPLPLLELREKRIDPAAEHVYDASTTERRRPQFQWLLLPALVLLAYEVFAAKGAGARGGSTR
jgi:Ca-activated chloride channel family protein